MKVIFLTLSLFLLLNAKIVLQDTNSFQKELKYIILNKYRIDSKIKIDIIFKEGENNSLKSFFTLTHVNKNSTQNINLKIFKNFFESIIDKRMDKNLIVITVDKELTNFEKILYTLSALDNILRELSIDFSKKFKDENLIEVIKNRGFLEINSDIKLNLNTIKKKVLYFPLKIKNNKFKFDKPFGKIVKQRYNYKIFYKNKEVSKIFPEYVKYSNRSAEKLFLLIDGEDREIEFGDVLDFEYNFMIKKSKYRANIIGLKRDFKTDESSIIVDYDMLDGDFSIDRLKLEYRVEFYNDKDEFVGLIILKKIRI